MCTQAMRRDVNMTDMFEEFELLRRQMRKDYNKLLAEQTREVELLLAELREMIATYRVLIGSVPARTEFDENKLRRERAIAFAKAKQLDEDETIN
jgi:hypothetical protein